MDGIVSRFFSFDKLIATGLIKVIYWIGLIFIVLAVIVGMFSGFSRGFGQGLLSLLGAPIGGLIGLIFWRFLCEIYIVIFGMYDRLGDIQKSLSGNAAPPSDET